MIGKIKVFDAVGDFAFEWSLRGDGGPSENGPLSARPAMLAEMRDDGQDLPLDIKGWRYTLVWAP